MLKKSPAILMVFFSVFFLFSCSAVNSALLYIGIDAHDYKNEPVINTLKTTDETVHKIISTLDVIVLDTIELKEFSSHKSVPDLYTDELLSYLLNTRFSKYNGNLTLMRDVESKYPGLYATTIIPADDFDSLMQKHFGAGSSVSHENGEIFRYLPKVNMYVTEVQPLKKTVDITVTSAEETEMTFRIKFKLTSAEGEERSYCGIFAKREKGDPYLKMLMSI